MKHISFLCIFKHCMMNKTQKLNVSKLHTVAYLNACYAVRCLGTLKSKSDSLQKMQVLVASLLLFIKYQLFF
jgi:hypothetical protein